MKEKKDYIRDIAEIRSMMEHSAKFLSLSGWAGICAGVYAIAGAWMANSIFHFDPMEWTDDIGSSHRNLPTSGLIVLALTVMILAVGTAVLLSYRKAIIRGEKIWSIASRRVVINMMVPLATGGLLVLIMISGGMIGLAIPLTLVFYGLALYNAGRDSYREVRMLGLLEIILGLISVCFIRYSLIIWALGFGLLHIVYGIYIHYKYER